MKAIIEEASLSKRTEQASPSNPADTIEIVMERVALVGSRAEFQRLADATEALSTLAVSGTLRFGSSHRLVSVLEGIRSKLDTKQDATPVTVELTGAVFETLGETYQMGFQLAGALGVLMGVRGVNAEGEFTQMFNLGYPAGEV